MDGERVSRLINDRVAKQLGVLLLEQIALTVQLELANKELAEKAKGE